jgi:phosphatidylserine/phosphatidylglycerophosphate/cardiolipin synthase-like enzyme
MSIELKVYDNGDHTCLVWLPADVRPIPGCRGFAISKICNGKQSYLHGAVGFSDADTLDPANPWKFPLQRYLWWDYFVQPGDVVQYSVVPVVGPDKDHLSLATDLASSLTPALTVEGQCTPHLSAYFNKGIVAAQWVSRALAKEPQDAKIKQVVAQPGDPLRAELSGLLRPRILSLLAEAKAAGGKIFAALYELDDPELIPALEALGADCSLILGNGAFGPGKPDENAAVRASLRKDSQVQVFDRMVSSGHFAHNKFVVFCDAAGNPQKVLTGSTNWTSSGLCTQANNGLVVDDPAVAADFLAAWHRIKDAGNAYPPALVQGNSTAGTHTVDGCTITPWFVATSATQDLADARRLIAAAKEGILFLFFNPGTFQQDPQKWTLLQNILVRHDQAPDLYVRGVVNQEIAELTEPAPAGKGGSAGAGSAGLAAPSAALDPSAPAPVTLYSGAVEPPERLSHDVLVPQNIKQQFHDWEKELLGASMVNIHSKVIVLDPFGENPVVMTGSHNLGYKASSANDDNLVIIQGNAPLAAAYAVNIIAIFQTYRWNSYVQAHLKDPKVWHGLVDNDDWQASYLTGDPLAEIRFWLGDTAATPAAGEAPSQPQAGPAPGQPAAAARTVVAPPKPPAARKAPAKKAPAAKRPTAKRAPAKKAAATRKSASAKASPRQATATKKPAAKKAPATKAAAAKRPTAKRAPAKKAAATRKPAGKKAGAAKRAPASKSGRKRSA